VIDFATLYQHPLSSPCVLWDQCDSHCCNVGKQVQVFAAETDLAVLPIPEVEFEYLRSVGAPDAQWADAKRSFDLQISDYELKVFMQPCNLGGNCDSALRPTICRVYPYIPLIDDDFKVAGTVHATAFDLVWREGSEQDPCLMRAEPTRTRHLALLDDLVAQLAEKPENFEVLLWFNLAFRYLEAFKGYLDENFPAEPGAIDEMSQRDVFQTLYLCNRTQLFLSAPEFRLALEAEVERYHRWSTHGPA